MEIVIIDGHTLNPGDLDWSALSTYGNVTVYDRSTYEEARDRLKNADIAVINKVRLDREMIDALPRLKYVAVTATGYNNLDVAYLKARNIPASNVTGYGAHAVAQHTFALLLELCNRTAYHQQKTIEGAWAQTNDFCYWSQPMTELYGLKMGIVGWGSIGSQVGRIAHAMDMEVLLYSPSEKNISWATQVRHTDEIFSTCDVISLHCTLTPETDRLINAQTLKLFKPGSFLINTSRGGLIDEPALIAALDRGQLAGAGLDVLSVEPPKQGNPLIHHPKCIVTPHNAWAPIATRQRLINMTVENIASFLQGTPKNLVTL